MRAKWLIISEVIPVSTAFDRSLETALKTHESGYNTTQTITTTLSLCIWFLLKTDFKPDKEIVQSLSTPTSMTRYYTDRESPNIVRSLD